MTATRAQARNEMLGVVRTAWLADASSLSLPLLWDDRGQEPPDSGAWARVTVKHDKGFPATLRGATGQRRFRKTGTLIVELYTVFGEGLTLSDTLSKIVTDALEGVSTTPGNVTFRDVDSREIGRSGQWFQTNVLAEFEYDEVR